MHSTQFPWRRPAAALSLSGAALFMAGLAATPWESEPTARAYHDALAAHPDQAQIAAIVLHVAYLLLAAGAFALIGVIGSAGGTRGRWWLRVGAGLVVLGATTMPGLLITDAYDLVLAQELPRDTSARVSDAVGELPLSAVLGMSAMLGFIVGPALLWIAAWRRRVVPVSVPALVVLSWLVGMASMKLPVLLAGAAILIAASGIATAHLWWVRPADETPGNSDPDGHADASAEARTADASTATGVGVVASTMTDTFPAAAAAPEPATMRRAPADRASIVNAAAGAAVAATRRA